jgi:signal peptidase II
MPATAARTATRGRARWPIFVGLAAIVFIADQLTKAWLTSFLEPGERVEVIGDLVRLIHSQNSGALFGLFQDQAILFGIDSLGVVAGIIWFHHSSGRNTLLSVALGLLLGGALGNMADRFRIGYVVDFVDVGIGNLRFYTFNVADSAISLSIL